MISLFAESYENLLQFIFTLYDFDRDGYITKEDIKVVLSYIPLNIDKTYMNNNLKSKYENENFEDRVESQDEIYNLLEKCFNNLEWIDKFSFKFVVENISSDLFLFPLIFILSKRPFSIKSLDEFEKHHNKFKFIPKIIRTPNPKFTYEMSRTKRFMIASPNVYSKLSPSSTIRKSPFWKSRTIINSNKNLLTNNKSFLFSNGIEVNDHLVKKHNDFLNKLGKNKGKDSLNILRKYSKPARGNRKFSESDKFSDLNNFESDSCLKSIDDDYNNEKCQDILCRSPLLDINNNNNQNNFKTGCVKENEQLHLDENVSIKKVPIFRKHINNLKNLENPNNIETLIIKDYSDIKVLPAIKYTDDKNSNLINDLNKNTIFSVIENGNLNNIPKFNFNSIDDDSDENSEDVIFEGYLNKISNSGILKKRYFKLIQKDLYCYKNKNDDKHKSLNNLSGAYFREGPLFNLNGLNFISFQIVNNNKARFFYIESSLEDEYKNWSKHFKKVTGYSDLNDTYQIGQKLGNGKFGIVRLGLHRATQRKVAIKIMNKQDMSFNDVQMVKTEIEILKICQHPYLIRLYEVYKNDEFIYIVMEYCSGGDLFSYMESRNFKISESHAAYLIHKISTAIYYLHSYGIVHRDLKPENILMTDNTDDSDIRIVDFGLSKIIGPNEMCTEPYGTISYVAPEILMERPYTKAVDIWSIGIISYLLLTGCLPFDDENSEGEIARKTIGEPLPLPNNLWKDISKEAKDLITNMLNKDPNKRMNIKNVLEHPWIQKHNKTILPEIRRHCKDLQQSSFKMYATTDLY